jgi:hypothetical protein
LEAYLTEIVDTVVRMLDHELSTAWFFAVKVAMIVTVNIVQTMEHVIRLFYCQP